MVDRSPGETTSTSRLTGGAIASLTGVGLLVIFMVQNTDDVKLDFLFWSFTWALWLSVPRDGAGRSARVVRIGRPASSPTPSGAPRGPRINEFGT